MGGHHAVLPQEFPGPHEGDRGFFPVRGGDGHSEPALLHEEDRVRRVALRKGRVVLFQIEDSLAQPCSGEKGFGIENRFPIGWFWLGGWKLDRLCKLE